MTSIRARKTRRDLRRRWGRATGVVIAMSIAVLAITAISTSFWVARTQQRDGYLNTNPPSATVVAEGLTAGAVARARAVPGVAAVDTARTVSARIRRPGDGKWQTMGLTARGDYLTNTIARLTPRTGAWPPPDDRIIIERSGLRLLSDPRDGDLVEVELPGRPIRTVTVAGTNSDPGAPPSWVEGIVYGYVTPDTLAGLGFTAAPGELRLLVTGDRLDRTRIRAVAASVRAELEAAGARVSTVDIPEPGRHPNQDLMNGLLWLELMFGALALTLAGLLTTTVMSGLLAGQTRQTGTLKALGARTGQVAAGYLTTATLLAGLACLVGWPLGRLAGLGFVGFVAEFMNFEVTDPAMPWWLVAAQLAAGLTLPLLIAGLLVVRAARITAVQAIREQGVTAPRPSGAGARLAGWLSRRTRLPRLPLLAGRNAFRRRGRLLLAVTALAFGGATFMAAANIADGFADTFVEQTIAAEPYDLTSTLDRPYPDTTLDSALSGVADVRRTEIWLTGAATSAAGDAVPLVGVPADCPDLKLRMLSGSWLSEPEPIGPEPIGRETTGPETTGREPTGPEPTGGEPTGQGPTGDAVRQIVLSKAFADDHAATVGGQVVLRIRDRAITWRVVGVAVQVGGPAAWVTRDDLAAATGAGTAGNVVRVVTTGHDEATVARVRGELELALGATGVTVVATGSQQDLRTTLVAHQIIFAVFLNLMTLLSVVVGGVGLATILTVAVTERTREIGVLRAVGATNRAVLALVVIEAVVIGVLSWVLAALILAVPTTVAFGTLMGDLLLGTPIAVTINGWAIAGWLVLVVAICAAASVIPARRAARMTVGSALAYD